MDDDALICRWRSMIGARVVVGLQLSVVRVMFVLRALYFELWTVL